MSETRTLGYAIEQEDRESLDRHGEEPLKLLATFKEELSPQNPDADPLGVVNILNQGSIGSCQGQSLAKMFQVCFFLKTGRVFNFSAMCGYVVAQKYDGLINRGDVGSTLSGGQRVATENGMCLESDWPYPSRYSNQIVASSFPFRLKSAKPTNNPDMILEALAAGLPVQTGMAWNSELEQERVTNYTGRGARGGHATTLWLRKDNQICHINSWGNWNGDGCSTWTEEALRQIVSYRGNTFVIYAPDGIEYPELPPVETP